MLSSKKAISPLIAAVLLIVVVVGIGAVVTGMIRGMVTDNKATIDTKSDEMVCSRDVVIDVLDVNSNPQMCKGTDYVYAILENTGSVTIDDFQLKVFGSTGIYTNDSVGTGTFSTGSSLEFNATFSSVGDVEQIKIIPKLKKTGAAGYNYCADVGITYETLEDCPI